MAYFNKMFSRRIVILLFCFAFFLHVSVAMIQIEPTTDGMGVIVLNSTQTTPANIDFQVLEDALQANSSENRKKIEAQGVACPTDLFNDLSLSYFTTTLSNAEAFRSQELPPFLQARFAGGPGNALVRQYITQQFRALNWQLETDTSIQITPLGPVSFTNVIATYNPTARKRLVLACHMDSLLSPPGFIGATDSAVACALLIDIAKRMNELFVYVIASRVAIQMIFFDGKEPFVGFSPTDSLYGSKHLASVWENTVDPVVTTSNKHGTIDYFILLSVLGHTTTQFERFFLETDDIYTKLIQYETCLALKGLLLRPLPLTRQFFQNTRRAIDVQDDHQPFKLRGVKVMHLISFPFPFQWHNAFDNQNVVDYNIVEDLNRILRVFIADYFVQGAFLTP